MARMTSSAGRNSSPTVRSGDATLRIQLVLHPVECHAGQPAILQHKSLRRAVDNDLDALFLCVLELPGRGLEESARLAGHHLDAPGAQSEARAAAIHGRVADTDDEDTLADPVDVLERNRLQPRDPDMDVRRALGPPGKLQLLALGGTR